MASVQDKPLYEEGGYTVRKSTLKTPKAVHRLSDIQTVSVRHTVALSVLPGVIVTAIGAVFWARYLYPIELLVIATACVVTGYASVSIATLRVSSLALAHHPDLGISWGYAPRLKRVRAAIIEAMALNAAAASIQPSHPQIQFAPAGQLSPPIDGTAGDRPQSGQGEVIRLISTHGRKEP